MRRISLLVVSLCAGLMAQQGGSPVKGIDIIVKPQKPGSLLIIKTDDSGTVRFRLPEAGTYTIEFPPPVQPSGAPVPAATILVQGQSKAVDRPGLPTKKADKRRAESKTGARGRMVMGQGAKRLRLQHPGIVFDGSGRPQTETLEVDGATDIMLQLSLADAASPDLIGLPPHLSLVGVEGAPGIDSHTINLASAVPGDWFVNFVPGNASTPGPRLSKTTGRIGPRGDSFNIQMPNGAAAGFYGGTLEFRRARDSEAVQLVPVYIRVLPRADRLPPLTDRTTYVGETAMMVVVNPNNVSEAYRMVNPAPRDGWSVQFDPEAFSLAPGTTQTVRVQIRRADGGDLDEVKELQIQRPTGDPVPFYLQRILRLPGAGTPACVPTKAYPVIARRDIPAAEELPGLVWVEAWDNCGVRREDAFIKVTSEDGAQGKAVKTEGFPNPPVPVDKKKKVSALSVISLPNGGEAQGETPSVDTRTPTFAALEAAQVPLLIEDIWSATSNEPASLAPGMRARARLLGTPAKAPIEEFLSVAGEKKVNAEWTDDGIEFDLPGVAASDKGWDIRFGGAAIGQVIVPGAASAPALFTREIDGVERLLLLKHANEDDAGEDYMTTGAAQPTKGDLVSVWVDGLGDAAEDQIGILIGGVSAQVKKMIKCPQDPRCRTHPKPKPWLSRVYFEMPEVPLAETGDGSADVQMRVGLNASNLGSILFPNPTGPGILNGFLVTTNPPGPTVQVNGNPFVYTVASAGGVLTLQFPTGPANFDVVPPQQGVPGNAYVRWDFVNWTFPGATVATAKVTQTIKSLQTATANFDTMIKVTLTGGTLSPKSADDFYKSGTQFTVTPTCPAGQTFDRLEASLRSLTNGSVIMGPIVLSSLGGYFIYPADLVVFCKPTVIGVAITVNTDIPPPDNMLVKPSISQGGLVAGPTAPAVTGNVNPSGGQVQVAVDTATVQITPALRYQLVNWSPNTGSPITALTRNVPATAATYTANYKLFANVTVKVTGGCTVTSPAPLPGYFEVGAPMTLTVTPGPAFQSASFGGPGASMPLSNGQTFNLIGAGQIDVVCSGSPAPVCPTGTVAAPAGPMTWFPMDSVTMPVRDIGSLALTANLAPSGAPLPILLTNGKVGRALQFTGNQSLSIPYNSVFDSLETGPNSAGFTIDAWVKRDSGAQDGGVILHNSRTTGLSGYYLYLDTVTGKPILALNAYKNVNGYEIFTGHPLTVPDDGNWHFVAVRLARGSNNATLDYWLDGTKHVYGTIGAVANLSTTIDYYVGCPTTAPCWSTPSTQPGLPIHIGGNGLPGSHYKGGLDELEFFQRPLSDAEIAGIYNAGANGKCKPPMVNVTVNTSPAINATVGIAGGSDPSGVYQTQLVGGSSSTLTAADPVLTTTGNYYRLQAPPSGPTWTPSGPNVTLPASGSATYTANYRLAGYRVTSTGCPVNLGPLAQRIQSNPDVYPAGALILISAAPPAGQALQSLVVTVGTNAPQIYTTSPVNVPLTGPLTIQATCIASTPIGITLVGNPNTAPQLTITYREGGVLVAGPAFGPGSAPPTLQIPGNPTGQLTLGANSQFMSNNTGYRLRDFTGPSGVVTSPFAAPNTPTTYTANYDVACYMLNFAASPTTGGTITANPPSGILNGFGTYCYAPNSVVTLTVTPSAGQSFTNWTGDATGTTTSVQVTMNAPKNVTANFGTANVTLTLVAKPATLGAQVSITRLPSGLVSQGTNITNMTLPPTGQVTLGGDAAVIASGVYHQRQNFTVQGSLTPVGPTLNVPAANTTYEANYNPAGYVVTLGGSGGCTVTVTNSNPPAIQTTPLLIVPVGANVSLQANAPAGQIVQSLTLTGSSGSQTTTGGQATLSVSTGILSGPVTATPICAAAPTVSVTVNTNQPGAGIPVGINGVGSAPNSYVNTVPAGSAQGLSAPATFVSTTGIGYRFVNWTPSGPGVTVPASGSITYTANYTVACWLVQWQTNPINTGTATFSPASGVAGFPTLCFAPGTGLTVSLTPIAGRIFTGWSPHSGGPGQTGSAPYTFTTTGPTNLLANTAPGSPSVNWIVQNRTNGNLGMNAVNNGTAAATNVRVLSVSGMTNGFAYSGTALPWTLTPNLPIAGVHGFNLNFSRASGAANAPFSFTMTVEVSGGSPTPVAINVP